MSKSKEQPGKEAVDQISLEYHLHDLPTAQHRAGLAGIVLQIHSMLTRVRDFEEGAIPEITELSSTSARIVLTPQSLQSLFDDLYHARVAEVEPGSKWAGKTQPKRVEEREITDKESGKSKKQKVFLYDVVQPHSPCLRQHLGDERGQGPWLKLWREMLWAIPRSQPTTRGPYNETAEGSPCSEAAKMWKELTAFEKDLTKGKLRTTKLSGALLLGAQEKTAEAIPFRDGVKNALLLHFWPLTVQIFVPQQIANDGKSEFVGYSIAIPDVADLELFLEEYPAMLSELSPDLRGYRPAASVVDLPEQGALEFMRHMSDVVRHRTQDHSSRVSQAVAGFEYSHLHKVGNNVKCFGAGRVSPHSGLLEQYEAIVRASPQPYRNPLFRSGLIRALLNGEKWYQGHQKFLAERPAKFFVRCSKTPGSMRSFATDAATKFRALHQQFLEELEDYEMTSDAATAKPPRSLELIIHNLIRHYILRKTEARSGIKYEDFKDKKTKDEDGRERMDVPRSYKEAREHISQDLFMALRSRRDHDFADYFTARVCSIPQFLSEGDYLTVARALLEDIDRAKTLSLLAVSANS